MKDRTVEEELAYYLEVLVDEPWVVGYISDDIVEMLEQSEYFDADSLSVTDKGMALLSRMGCLTARAKSARSHPSED